MFNSFLKWRADIVRALSGLLVCLWKKTLKEASLTPKQGGAVVTYQSKICEKPACGANKQSRRFLFVVL